MASISRNNLDMGEASKKRVPGSEYMLLCHKVGETMHHIFIESTFTKGVWELTRATKNTLIQYVKPNNINRMWSHDYLQWATRGGKHKIRTIIRQYYGMCVNKKNYTIFSDKISSIISCSLYIQDDILWWRDTAMEGANGGSGQHQIGREAEGGWTSYTRWTQTYQLQMRRTWRS